VKKMADTQNILAVLNNFHINIGSAFRGSGFKVHYKKAL